MGHKSKPESEALPVRRRYQKCAGWWHPQRGRKEFEQLIDEWRQIPPSALRRRRAFMQGWKMLHHGNIGTRHVLYVDLGQGYYEVVEKL